MNEIQKNNSVLSMESTTNLSNSMKNSNPTNSDTKDVFQLSKRKRKRIAGW